MKYLIYHASEGSRFVCTDDELIGVSYGHDIEQASPDIQKYMVDDMTADSKFDNCNILPDTPFPLNATSVENMIPYNYLVSCIAYPKYEAAENLVEYYGIVESYE